MQDPFLSIDLYKYGQANPWLGEVGAFRTQENQLDQEHKFYHNILNITLKIYTQ